MIKNVAGKAGEESPPTNSLTDMQRVSTPAVTHAKTMNYSDTSAREPEPNNKLQQEQQYTEEEVENESGSEYETDTDDEG